MTLAPQTTWQKGKRLTADNMNELQRAIIATLVGGNGINIKSMGNRVGIELTGNKTSKYEDVQRQTKIPFYNNSGEKIPPNSFVMIDGFTTEKTVQVKKPDADSISPYRLLILGNGSIEAGKYGYGWSADLSKSFVKYSDDSTVPAADDDFGSIADSWEGKVGNSGFKVASIYDTEGQLAYIAPFRQHGLWWEQLTGVQLTNIPYSPGGVIAQEYYTGEITEYYCNLFRPIPDNRISLITFGLSDGIPVDCRVNSNINPPAVLNFDGTISMYGIDTILDLGTLTWATRPMGTLLTQVQVDGSLFTTGYNYGGDLWGRDNILEVLGPGFDVQAVRIAFSSLSVTSGFAWQYFANGSFMHQADTII